MKKGIEPELEDSLLGEFAQFDSVRYPFSTRMINAFMPVVGSWNALHHAIEYHLPHMEFDTIYVSPLFSPSEASVDNKASGSPYAMIAAGMNPAYNDGEVLTPKQTISKISKTVALAHDKGINMMFDFVPNHIGHDCKIFDPDGYKDLLDDPIFGVMARAIDAGEIKAEDIFAPRHEKRSPEVSADWTDVCEVRASTPEQIANAAKYFWKPYLKYIAKCGRPKEYPDLPVNIRIDTPRMLPADAWAVLAPLIEKTLSSPLSKEKPLVMLETIGESRESYAYIKNSFSNKAQEKLLHLNESTLEITPKKDRHPRDVLSGLSINNHDGAYWASHHHDQAVLGINQVGITNTHDMPHCSGEGINISSYLERYGFEGLGFERMKKLYVSMTALVNPSHMVMYGDHIDHHFKQPEFGKAEKIEFNHADDSSAERFMMGLNCTHKKIHNSHLSRNWSEIAYDPENPDHMLVILRPEEGYTGIPTLILVNAHEDDNIPMGKTDNPKENADKIANLVSKLYSYKTPTEFLNKSDMKPLFLVGEYNLEDVFALQKDHFSNVYLNGSNIKEAAKLIASAESLISSEGNPDGENQELKLLHRRKRLKDIWYAEPEVTTPTALRLELFASQGSSLGGRVVTEEDNKKNNKLALTDFCNNYEYKDGIIVNKLSLQPKQT
jgi:hypothetical protein